MSSSDAPIPNMPAIVADRIAMDMENQTLLSSADQNIYWIGRTIRESIPTVFEYINWWYPQ